MLKKIKIFLAAIGVLGAIGNVFAKEAPILPIVPENPDGSKTNCPNAIAPDCDTYVFEMQNQAVAMYAVPNIRDEKPINRDDVVEKYGIPDEDKPIIINDNMPVLKYGLPQDKIIKKRHKKHLPVVKYGIPNTGKETK